MTGTTSDIIPIVIIPVLALVFWLGMIYYANSHPRWGSQAPPVTVNEQLRLNDYRQSLVRLVGPALTVLVTVGQLGTGNRFKAIGPPWLDPASLSALVASGFFFALYYGNTNWVSTHLRNRLSATDTTKIAGTDTLPTEAKANVKRRVEWAFGEYIAGFLFLFVAVGFFVAFLWT
jgi:hypothetical protein